MTLNDNGGSSLPEKLDAQLPTDVRMLYQQCRLSNFCEFFAFQVATPHCLYYHSLRIDHLFAGVLKRFMHYAAQKHFCQANLPFGLWYVELFDHQQHLFTVRMRRVLLGQTLIPMIKNKKNNLESLYFTFTSQSKYLLTNSSKVI